MLTDEDAAAVLLAIDEAVIAGACTVSERHDKGSATVWRAVGRAHSRRASDALASIGSRIAPQPEVD
jgi:hypothetical protein